MTEDRGALDDTKPQQGPFDRHLLALILGLATVAIVWAYGGLTLLDIESMGFTERNRDDGAVIRLFLIFFPPLGAFWAIGYIILMTMKEPPGQDAIDTVLDCYRRIQEAKQPDTRPQACRDAEDDSPIPLRPTTPRRPRRPPRG